LAVVDDETEHALAVSVVVVVAAVSLECDQSQFLLHLEQQLLAYPWWFLPHAGDIASVFPEEALHMDS
jgi:hypothetical protein